jgi:hypothetical protein
MHLQLMRRVTHQQACPQVIELGFLDLERLLKGLFVILRRSKVLAVGGRLAVLWLLGLEILLRWLWRVGLSVALRRAARWSILLVASCVGLRVVVVCCLALMRHDGDALGVQSLGNCQAMRKSMPQMMQALFGQMHESVGG